MGMIASICTSARLDPFGRILLAVALLWLHVSRVHAEIPENRTLLLYNSLDPDIDPATGLGESEAIALYYQQFHPEVILCDLGVAAPGSGQSILDYTSVENPPNCGATRVLITPCKFKQIFIDGPSPFTAAMAAHPDLLCIITTRGIPTLITTAPTPASTWDPSPGGPIYPITYLGHYTYGSVESFLMGIRFPEVHSELDDGPAGVPNPIYETGAANWIVDESDVWFEENCSDDSTGCPLAVSRLDSAPFYTTSTIVDGDSDPDFFTWLANSGTPTKSAIQCVKELILRSRVLRVNQYACTVISDTSPSELTMTSSGAGVSKPPSFEPTTQTAWVHGWCYVLDESGEFLIGKKAENVYPDQWIENPCDPEIDPECTLDADVVATEWPPITVMTMGRNGYYAAPAHPEVPSRKYVALYSPHPAGLFLSSESFNGWAIHSFVPGNPNNITYPNGHGQAIEWIAAGGSFTMGAVHEPTSNEFDARTAFKSLYVEGRQWGEVALGSLKQIGWMYVPLGDPLATVTTYSPDVVEDHMIDDQDLEYVEQAMVSPTPDPAADINGDGFFNAVDRAIVLQAYGRNCPDPPHAPTPGSSLCGDLSDNGVVTHTDVDIFQQAYVAAGGEWGAISLVDVPCPTLENWTTPCIGDCDGDAVLGEGDYQIIMTNNGMCKNFDLCDDDIINVTDATLFTIFVFEYAHQAPITPENPLWDESLDYNCDGMIEYNLDAAIINTRASGESYYPYYCGEPMSTECEEEEE
jgi:hypothetical protein